ncbi:MAG: hypothetical protein QOI98_1407 [Solirubrobacteraceae bacterium]|nr:hypothetical protein [Solirubrobacteraceae bacterium]
MDDLLASLRAHEPGVTRIVLVDDEPDARRLDRHLDDGVEVLPNPRGGRGIGTLGGTCTATLAALRRIHDDAPGAHVIRLDTDALVIAPFADRLARALEQRPDAGVVGSYDRTCNGEPRDFAPWADVARRHARLVWTWRHPPRGGRYVQLALTGRLGVVRREVRAALRHGYQPGEHCLAAACVVSARMVGAMAQAGMLDDPARWLNTRFGDDIMLGVQARALGLDLVGLVADGEPFGLRHIGLADRPARLVERGFSFIHSVKNDPEMPEDEIRGFFAERR